MRSVAALIAILTATPAVAIDRAEVMDRARALAFHPWRCGANNLQASCASGYDSAYVVGDHLGLPYDWGGFVSLHEFGVHIGAGYGAGSPAGGSVLSCTTGLDCSGFVSECWGLDSKLGTATLEEAQYTSPISTDQVQPGDVFNKANEHVVMFDTKLADGTLVYLEASPPNTRVNAFSSWAGVQGYSARRYVHIEDGGSDLGTLSNPIPITTWPYTDATRDTTDGPSDLLDACAADPSSNESGREWIYAFTTETPGMLSASVSCGTGVDVDLHLYAAASEAECFARAHTDFEVSLSACGTYFLVVDTWVSGAGVEQAGAYTLTVDFEASGGACQAMPSYDFVGAMGEPCSYPGNTALGYCNPNLDAATCLYTDTDSFCSRPCGRDSDCTSDLPGGCCADIGDNQYFCLPSDYCGGSPPPGDPADPADGGPDLVSYPPPQPGGDRDLGTDAGGCKSTGSSTAWLVVLLLWLVRRRSAR